MRQRYLLILEDDTAFRERLARAMRERGFRVLEAADLGELSRLLAAGEKITHAIVDLRLGAGNGINAIAPLRTHNAGCRIVVLTGFGSIASTVEAMRLGAADVLTKPADARLIARALLGGEASDFDLQHEPPSLARVEWEHMQRILAECEGNVSRAARLLGIDRRSLQRKLQKYPPKK
jgi:two-component system response regulator RegA